MLGKCPYGDFPNSILVLNERGLTIFLLLSKEFNEFHCFPNKLECNCMRIS